MSKKRGRDVKVGFQASGGEPMMRCSMCASPMAWPGMELPVWGCIRLTVTAQGVHAECYCHECGEIARQAKLALLANPPAGGPA
jgi:hypothetical protein